MVSHAAQAARVCLLMLQCLVVGFNTLNCRPGLLGLDGWHAVLSLQETIHIKVKAAVLLKKASNIVETLALLVSVLFRPRLYGLALVLLCKGILLEIRQSLSIKLVVFASIIDTWFFVE